jgi:hypothetical protein
MRELWTRRKTVQLMASAGTGLAVTAAAAGGPATAAQATTTVDLGRLRKYLAARGALPLERLTDFEQASAADEILANGWAGRGEPPLYPGPDTDWVHLASDNRSWQFNVQSWVWAGPVLAAYEETGDRRYLSWCLEAAASWARTFTTGTGAGTMAWYDMAVGLRAYRLAYLTEQAVLGGADPKTINLLLACIARHQREFRSPRIFAPTNHGYYVAAGQIALARRFRILAGMDDLYALGQRRMRTISLDQFSADGGHREHSPGYHHMVLTSFRAAIATGLITDPEVKRRVARAEDVLGWMVQPNGEIVSVGDSSPLNLRSLEPDSPSATTQFILTGGKRGTPNPAELMVLPQTGYAVVRSPQPVSTDDHTRSSYLFVQAGYHSTAHKHADDLSFTWFDRGREILIDAGKFGYLHRQLPAGDPMRRKGFMYSAPERQYIETTQAHNTVAADGLDHGRYGRTPFGSALAGAQQRNGHFRIQAIVNHGHWRHRREIILRPGRWLLVTDTAESRDGRPHDFRVWWNLPEALRPVADGTGRLRVGWPDSGDFLWITELNRSATVTPLSGHRKPLRGWRSRGDRQFTPSWSTGFQALNRKKHVFRTLFHFGAEPRTTPFQHPFG